MVHSYYYLQQGPLHQFSPLLPITPLTKKMGFLKNWERQKNEKFYLFSASLFKGIQKVLQTKTAYKYLELITY